MTSKTIQLLIRNLVCPSRPLGRTNRRTSSSPNDSVTACSGPNQYEPKLSMMPSTSPPTIAPGTLPRPPSTQTTNALPRNSWPFSGEIGKMMLSNAPAAPAMKAPMANVTALMCLTSTPISAAASRSMRTATMARPIALSRSRR